MKLYEKNKNEKFFKDSLEDAKESYMWNPNYAKSYYIIAKLHFLDEIYDKALENILFAS